MTKCLKDIRLNKFFIFLFYPVFIHAQNASESQAQTHFAMGSLFALEGKPAQAIEHFTLSLAYNPKILANRLNLAKEYKKLGRFSESLEECRQVLAVDPKNIPAKMILAELHVLSKQTDLALKEYQLILKQDPHHSEALVFAVELYLELSEPKKALNQIELFLKKNPASLVTYYYSARAYHDLNQSQKALSYFEKAILKNPNFLQSYMSKAQIFEEKGHFDLAEKEYEMVFQNTEDASIGKKLVDCLLKQKKFSRAVEVLSFILANDPQDLNVALTLALTYMSLKDFSHAEQCFQKILIKNAESDVAHYYLSSIYEIQGKNKEALQELKSILAESSFYPEAFQKQVILLQKQGEQETAMALIEEAIQKNPLEVKFYFFKAALLDTQNKTNEAIVFLESCLSSFKGNENIHIALSRLYEKQDQEDKSNAHAESVIKINPNNAEALNRLGYSLILKKQKLDLAERFLKKAVQISPQDGAIQDSWGWYHYVKGNLSVALKALEKAHQLIPKEPTILEHLADTYSRLHLVDKAMKFYLEAEQYVVDRKTKKKLLDKVEFLLKKKDTPGKKELRLSSEK